MTRRSDDLVDRIRRMRSQHDRPSELDLERAAALELLVDIRDAIAATPAEDVDLVPLEREIGSTLARFNLGGRAGPLELELVRVVRQFLRSNGIGKEAPK